MKWNANKYRTRFVAELKHLTFLAKIVLADTGLAKTTQNNGKDDEQRQSNSGIRKQMNA